MDFVAKPKGMVSLEIDRLRPILIEKIRGAAKAKIRRTHRLTERIRHQLARTGVRAERARAPRPTSPSERANRTPGLVLIGSSTGGPAALDIVLPHLPRDLSWPVLVAQHMPASFTGAFAKRLDRICELNVVEVSRPMPLLAGTIYIARGDADVIVSSRSSGVNAMPVPAQRDYPWHPSVERMVTSALEHYDACQTVRCADDRNGPRRRGRDDRIA